eukprot:TRINITY_DN6873_c1_g2_i2.p2 TRINITY_DN6873_c1_g2~~TRINITY_DN6873_c1_g2_i2.p2  ORF type:complete len:111 (-),score=13.70 TRINITY_DN6873_c1_g2_i2:10-342(-)
MPSGTRCMLGRRSSSLFGNSVRITASLEREDNDDADGGGDGDGGRDCMRRCSLPRVSPFSISFCAAFGTTKKFGSSLLQRLLQRIGFASTARDDKVTDGHVDTCHSHNHV